MAVRKAVEELDEDTGLNDLVRHNRLQSLYFCIIPKLTDNQ